MGLSGVAMDSAVVRAVVTADCNESTSVNRGSFGYLSARAWPDSPRRMIFVTWGDWSIS